MKYLLQFALAFCWVFVCYAQNDSITVDAALERFQDGEPILVEGKLPLEDTDFDMDRIVDIDDNCPDTPAGVKVDECGCPIDLCKIDSDKDGVPDCLDKCKRTLKGLSVNAQGCPLPITKRTRIRLDVKFKYAEAGIQGVYVPDLERLRALLVRFPNLVVTLEGHTDWRGSDSYNDSLSDARARICRRYILRDSRINPDRIRAVGYGERQPIASNRTESGMALNRRTVAEIDLGFGLKQPNDGQLPELAEGYIPPDAITIEQVEAEIRAAEAQAQLNTGKTQKTGVMSLKDAIEAGLVGRSGKKLKGNPSLTEPVANPNGIKRSGVMSLEDARALGLVEPEAPDANKAGKVGAVGKGKPVPDDNARPKLNLAPADGRTPPAASGNTLEDLRNGIDPASGRPATIQAPKSTDELRDLLLKELQRSKQLQERTGRVSSAPLPTPIITGDVTKDAGQKTTARRKDDVKTTASTASSTVAESNIETAASSPVNSSTLNREQILLQIRKELNENNQKLEDLNGKVSNSAGTQ